MVLRFSFNSGSVAMKILSLLLVMGSSSGVILDCIFSTQTCQYSSSYSCSLTVVDYRNATTITEIRGKHIGGKGNNDVDGLLSFAESKLDKIPQGIEKFFPNLVLINWSNGALKVISAKDLKPFTNLTSLNLFSNKITSLDGDLFKYTPELERISFSFNMIKHVDYHLLDNLFERRQVQIYFLSNQCINSYAFDKDSLTKLKNELREKCPMATSPPPVMTTTQPTTTEPTIGEGECSIRCSVNKEIDDLRRRVDALEKKPHQTQ